MLLRGLRSVINPMTYNRYCFGLIKFKLPDLGERIKQGTIKKIYVQEGDKVEEFQKLADVASDKQFTQITASDTGIIKKIHYQEEQVCQVGDLFLEIETQGATENQAPQKEEQKISSESVKQENRQTQTPKQQKSSVESGTLATPFVRGLIKSHGLDINKIKGSGPDGRILEKDVENMLNQKQPEQRKDASSVKTPQVRSTVSEVTTLSMSAFERGMQKSMTESNTIPHLYLHQEFDITEVEKMRKTLKQSKKKVTVMGILVKTFSLALKQYPRMNSVYDPETNPYEYSIHPNHNISIAIDSPNGLVVPHIKNVNNISLLKIQSELERLRTLAAEAKLTAKELQGGTICLSNIGTIGGTHACPLILPPQICIVAIGKLQTVPKYRNGELVERKVLNVSFGCDHRVVDGATVARFSNAWKELIENPYLSMAEMI